MKERYILAYFNMIAQAFHVRDALAAMPGVTEIRVERISAPEPALTAYAGEHTEAAGRDILLIATVENDHYYKVHQFIRQSGGLI